MRIWDVNPGYLNRQSLLGEHRELHGIVSILTKNKKGYSQHPETLRWVGYRWAIKQRHNLLSAEMSLRGYKDKSPVNLRSNKDQWPTIYIDTPLAQLGLLKQKYIGKDKGRIPFPNTAQQLWNQHKLSVIARGTSKYKKIDSMVKKYRNERDISDFYEQLIIILRQRPSRIGILNSLQDMWKYVSPSYTGNTDNIQNWSEKKFLREIQKLSLTNDDPYINSSTALSELDAWL